MKSSGGGIPPGMALSLTGGVHIIPFTDGDPNVRVGHGTDETLFVVMALTSDAQSQSLNSFTVTHLTDPAGNVVSQAEDAIADTSLNLAFSEDVSAGLVISGSIGAKIYLPVVLAP